jgi:hypothetical protein
VARRASAAADATDANISSTSPALSVLLPSVHAEVGVMSASAAVFGSASDSAPDALILMRGEAPSGWRTVRLRLCVYDDSMPLVPRLQTRLEVSDKAGRRAGRAETHEADGGRGIAWRAAWRTRALAAAVSSARAPVPRFDSCYRRCCVASGLGFNAELAASDGWSFSRNEPKRAQAPM